MTTIKEAAEKHGSALSTIPLWVVQAIFGLLLTSGVAWVTWATASSWKHEARIAVTETKVDAVKQDISDIKGEQKAQSQKLDDIKTILIRRGR